MENFLTPNGARLVKDMQLVQLAAKAKGARLVTARLTDLMTRQVLLVLDNFSQATGAKKTAGHGVKASVTVSVEQHGDLWARAIADAFKILGKEVEVTMRPAMQSVGDDVLEKTTQLLTGQKPSIASKRVLQQSVNDIAREVTGINKTTQNRLARLISRSIDGGKSPGEVMEEVRRKIPQIATNRVPTIVRTEMGKVADKAAIRSMKDSEVVTHVSVFGCMAVEKGSPTFRGTSTCNIKNVPIEYAGDLRFHVNHTGAITSSGFKKASTGKPTLALQEGEAESAALPSSTPATPASRPVTPTPVTPVSTPKPIPATVDTVKPIPAPLALPAAGPVLEPVVIPAAVDAVPLIPSAPSAPVVPDAIQPSRLPGIPDVEQFSRMNAFAAKFMTADDALAVQLYSQYNGITALDVDTRKGSDAMQAARRFSDEKPTFLSRDKFMEKAKGMHPIGHFDRGVSHRDPLGELKKDKAWQGSGLYGDGYYHQLASTDKITLESAIDGSVSTTALSYALSGTSEPKVMIGFLSKEARVITSAQVREMREEMAEYLESLPQGAVDFAKVIYRKESISDLTEEMVNAVRDDYAGFDKLRVVVRELVDNDGSFARLRGYDAVHVEGRGYLVVVNNRHYNLLDETFAVTN
jgi:hypothetical protein